MILPTRSPDGARIAYASTVAVPSTGDKGVGTPFEATGGVFDLWLINGDGSGRIRLKDAHTANYARTFSGDGRIFFTSDRSGQDNIWSLLPGGRAVPSSPDTVVMTRHLAAATDMQ